MATELQEETLVQLDEFDIEAGLPAFLFLVLDKLEECFDNPTTYTRHIQAQYVVVDKTVNLLRSIAESNEEDRLEWEALAQCDTVRTGAPGRPSFYIPAETLEDLRGIGFSWQKIAQFFGVSRWTVYRRVQAYGLQNMQQFNAEIDDIVAEYLGRHGFTTGRTYLAGYLRSLGLRIQRRRVRESLTRVDPQNTALRWGIVIARRKYSVPWPNSLWHLDGHHSLIRWGLVVHGCIDGFSRRIMFLKCSNNNLSQTVLELFMNAIEKDGLWPSRIRVDHGVENVLVCDAMVSARDAGLLNINSPIDLFALHLTFIPRINFALREFLEGSNHHRVRTANHWSPYQMWVNGMLNTNNPLAHGELDEDPDDLAVYGIDPAAPSPFEDSDNNVVVPPVNLPGDNQLIQSYVEDRIDPLMPSTEMGIDIYEMIHQIIQDNI
ncbi:hypothetical protein AWC38_SpisGene3841 [Paramuricea clavata]|uniref:Integrase core domain-containing protein n=2 Tax=Paramuricea clavata TaxID=317549 RepID=A0A6S7IQF7_PARCT|nr:hypothetical protein AWC38_SpisGene3841 [Paramuricea clavata]